MPDKDNFNAVVINGQGGSDYQVSENVTQTLTAATNSSGNNKMCVAAEPKYLVRRLTPLECTRLQGFPDRWLMDIKDWTDEKGKLHKESDSPRYKALGNSIALPQWYWLERKMQKHLSENATMMSLFSGIGGFDITWELIYGPHTARTESEIEAYPHAVTEFWFGDEDKGIKGHLYTDDDEIIPIEELFKKIESSNNSVDGGMG